MKIQITFLLAFFLCTNAFTQIKFEKGYFINNQNQKIECLIKNSDWKNNPTSFDYKLDENSEVKTNSINNAIEFGIYNFSKYIRADIMIDRSSVYIDKLNYNRNLTFNEERLFLKILIEGKANLYYFEDSEINKFFFNIDSTNIQQLTHKAYKIAKTNKIAYNNDFRMQLWNTLKCKDILISDFETLDYRQKDFTNLFVKYNNCQGKTQINFNNLTKKKLFNITLKSGLRLNSLKVQKQGISTYEELNFGNKSNFTFGVELENVFAFNKNKWSLFLEPTFQSYQSTVEDPSTTSNFIDSYSIDNKSIELAIGGRHYFFINDTSKIFLSVSYVFDSPLNSKMEVQRGTSNYDVEISKSSNSVFGLGYKYLNKYNIEFRYTSSRAIFKEWYSKYGGIYLIFGYNLL